MRFRYPMLKRSLRSGSSKAGSTTTWRWRSTKTARRRSGVVHLDYVYSSTCPCSLELAEHARRTRNQIATPHSQRSVARVSVELVGDGLLWFEDVVDLCNAAIPTETQVMVKREDEQAFAELNGSNPIFVEDAVRLLCDALATEPRIGDFRVVASHQESLHSHDAVSILTVGETFHQRSYDPRLFEVALPGRLTGAGSGAAKLTRSRLKSNGLEPAADGRFRSVHPRTLRPLSTRLRKGRPASTIHRSFDREAKEMASFDRITQEPGTMGGKACIRGLRVTVGMVVGQIGAGHTVDEVLADFPYLEREDVMQALRYAAWRAEEREIVLRGA